MDSDATLAFVRHPNSDLGGTLTRRGLGVVLGAEDPIGESTASMTTTQLPAGLDGHQQRRQSMPGSDSDSDHEGAFLQDLESRSVKWLHEMRRQKEKTIW